MRESLSQISQIVSVGSVDGICTTAALLRLIGRDDVDLQFTQAFTVDKIDVSKWTTGQKVAFVDLAVNNRDKTMTVDFVRRVRDAGHEIVAVIDEHNREDWEDVLGTFDGLIVEPQSQSLGIFKSSGAVLKAVVGPEVDDYTVELLDAADAGDRMDFTTHFGRMVNEATKSDIANDARRIYLARHFAQNTEPDEKIAGWIAEYEEILENHRQIIAAKVYLGDGIVRVIATGKKVDMTTLMSTLYHGDGVRSFFHGDCAKVVVMETETFVPAKKAKEVLVSIGTDDKSLDLMAIVRAVDITPLGGFAQKVNIALADEALAIAVIRPLLG